MKTINWEGKTYNVPEKYRFRYRLLDKNEVIKAGDLFICDDNQVKERFSMVGKKQSIYFNPTLRKIKSKNKLKFRAGDKVKINGFPREWPVGKIVQVLKKNNSNKGRDYLVQFDKEFVIKDKYCYGRYGYETQFCFNEQYLEKHNS